MKKLITHLVIFALPFMAFAQNNGELDLNFGNNGFLYPNLENGTAEYFQDMAVLPNDQFIMVGYALFNSSFDLLIAKFNSDGTIDASFGTAGHTTIDILGDSEDRANKVVVLDDGRILVIGITGFGDNPEGFIMRLDEDGKVDESFGIDGPGYTLLNAGTFQAAYAEDIYVVSNNNILVAGTVASEETFDFCVFKLTQGGGLDNNFGNDGAFVMDVNETHDFLTSITVDSDNRIILAGFSTDGDVNKGTVMRRTSYGTPDNSFNGTGYFTFSEGTSQTIIGDVAVTNNDKIVIVGSEGEVPNVNGFVFQFNEDGSLDTDFGGAGKVYSDVGATNGVYLYSIDLLPGNRILTTGHIFGNSMQSVYALMLKQDGTPDTGFSSGGDIDHEVTEPAAELVGAASGVQSDGSILIGGTIASLDLEIYNMFLSRISNSVTTNTHETYITNPTLSVFPNPILSAFSIELEDPQTLESVELMNLQGQRLQQWTGSQSVYQLSPDIPAGHYVVVARSGETLNISKIQVVR